jgi:hypothetical protein
MSREKEVLVDKKEYDSMVLFSYSTEHLLKKDKIRFYYALKGRDGKTGIVKACKIDQIGRAVLLVHDKFSDEVKDFLKLWKCKFEIKEALIKK